MRRFIYFFGEGQADGGGHLKHLVGGKGASLADMTKAQLQVPPGFTIATECCDLYYRGGKQWPDDLEEEIRVNLERLEKLAGRKFGHGENPLLVAVRSGAEQSMPGMMDTVLNVGLNPECVRAMANSRNAWEAYSHFLVMFGHTVAGIGERIFRDEIAHLLRETNHQTEAELDAGQLEELCQRFRAAYRTHAGQELPTDPWAMLVAAINAVFGSWNNERAIAYRKHHHIHGLLGTAVTVQMMCPSEVSGVLFTANPVDPTLEQLIIESSYGLGEAIVLGKVTPDRFVIDKTSGKVIEREIAHKDHVITTVASSSSESRESASSTAASLTDPQIEELARLGCRVEDYFQMPCDIEWGLSAGKFYLLQARAIKGLEDAKLIQQVRRDAIDQLKRQANGTPSAWVIHNLAETLPQPTPMTWSIMARFMSGDGGYGQMYQDLGFQPSQRVKQEGFLDLICGRIFLDTRRHAQLFWGDGIFEYDLDLIQREPAQAEAMPTRFSTAAGVFNLIVKSIATAWKTGRVKKRVARLKRDFDRQFNEQILPPYLDYVRRQRSEDLSRYDDVTLVRELGARLSRVLGEFGKEAVKLSYFGGEAYAELHARLRQLFRRASKGDVEATALASELSAGLDHGKTVEANLKLMDIAQGKLTREQFLAEFGHRASQEFELAQPRWREDPSFLDHMIDSFKANLDADPHALHDKMKQKRLEAERTLPDRLKARHQGAAIPEITDLSDQVRRYLPFRETAKHYLLMGYELLRLVLLEIDRRQGLAGGVFYLQHQELPELMSGRNFAKEIAERRERRRAELRVNVPEVILSSNLEVIGQAAEVGASGNGLHGTPVAPGSGTGPAAIVFDPAEAKGLTSGYILVCPSTDPGWTPLFIRAAGLIMERGGVLSHGAVVARDLGIPAVVIKGATKSIAGGELIRVDGNTGSASRVSGRAPATLTPALG